MGLLDDAIREHLELKRRRGADPGEVAREEREVLSAEPREPEEAEHEASWAPTATAIDADGHTDAADEAEAEAHDADEHPHAAEQADVAVEHVHAGLEHAPAAAQHASDEGSAGMQETAEIDMSRVLESDQDGGASRAPAPARRAPQLSSDLPGPGVFEDPDGGRHGHVPGQESFPFE